MKNVLLSVLFLFVSAQASAAVTSSLCLKRSGCWASVTTDGGNGIKCNSDDTDGCACTPPATSCTNTKTVANGGSCGAGWSSYFLTVTGSRCCVQNCLREDAVSEMDENLVQSSELEVSDQLAQAFSAPEDRAMSYFGYISSTPRSPTNGRAALAPAMLDICLGEANSPGSSWTNCYTNCGDSAKNGYCQNSGYNNDGGGTSYTAASVCKDRCDCVWGEGACENL